MSRSGGESGRTARIEAQLQQGFLLTVVVAVTLLFLYMIRGFLVTVILAGVFASMGHPVFETLTRWLRGRRRTASIATVLGLLLIIVLPLGSFLALVVAQAVEVGEVAGPWVLEQSSRWPELAVLLQNVPLIGELAPERAEVVGWISEAVSRVGSVLVDSVGAATSGTLNGVLQLFVMLYAMYFFLLEGSSILRRLLYYTPLEESDEREVVAQFESVTRATIKGSLAVGLIQGALGGLAFFVLGVPGAAFWSTVMAVLSIIPLLGSGLVWGPAAVILMVTGRLGAGLALAIWGVAVVSTIDNFVRPRLVGRDTKMHDLLVLLSTFGGLAMFGVVGFIVGPIIAAVFLTVWRLYGVAFRDFLPAVEGETI